MTTTGLPSPVCVSPWRGTRRTRSSHDALHHRCAHRSRRLGGLFRHGGDDCSRSRQRRWRICPESVPGIGRIWQGFKSDVERPIAVILLLNTAAHTIGASIAGAQFGEVFGEEHLWLFAAVFTFVMLQFTEILAKSLGVRFNRGLAIVIARPLQFSSVALRPILWFIHLINRPFEGRGKAEDGPATIEEITALAGLARLASQITPHQERIIATAPRLSEFRVRDIRIPLADIAWLDASKNLEEAIAEAKNHLHTRYPVCEGGDVNKVAGYVNVKEMLFLATDEIEDAREQLPVRPILTVSEEDSAADVMATFIQERVHIAVVQDGDGNTSGMVTFEDVVEELLGDIRDEFDRLPRHLQGTGDGRWLVGGGISMCRLADELSLDAPELGERSLAAWLEERVEPPMRSGSTLDAHGLRFTARRLKRGSLFECEIRRVESPSEAGDDGGAA